MRDARGLLLERVSQAGAPVLGLVPVHATILHWSEKQCLVLVTLFGPMMKLGDGNLLFVQVLETTNWHLVRRTVLANVSRGCFAPLLQRIKISPFDFFKTLGS
jgi:hypothetical protein